MLVTTVSIGIGGCSFVPAYHRPVVSTAAEWDAASPQGQGPTTVRANWWQHFGSPELDRLMARSLTDSLTLQAAIARVREAEGTARIAAAPLFPTIDGSGSFSKSTRSGTGSGTNSGSSSGSSVRTVVQASYELDFWGKNRAAAASGAALARASGFDAGTVAMTLTASVADGYFTIMSLRERISLAKQLAADARKTLALVRVQRSAGTATDLQIRQQETVVATFDAAVPALEQQLAAAMHALAVLVGQPPEGFVVDDAALASIARPAISADLPPQLLALRPDIQADEARLVSANFDIGVARAAFFPSLSLSASGGAGTVSAAKLTPLVGLADAGASLLAPLFEGGQLSGQLKYSRARQVEMVATYRQTVLTAFQEVEDALSAVSGVSAQEEIEAHAVISAQAAADLARTQYRLGSADYLSVLATQQTLYQARDTLAQLHLQHLQALVSLCRALGGGFGRADLALARLPTTDQTPPTNGTQR